MLQRVDWYRDIPNYTERMRAMSVYVWFFRVKNGEGWGFHPDFLHGLSLVPMEK